MNWFLIHNLRSNPFRLQIWFFNPTQPKLDFKTFPNRLIWVGLGWSIWAVWVIFCPAPAKHAHLNLHRLCSKVDIVTWENILSWRLAVVCKMKANLTLHFLQHLQALPPLWFRVLAAVCKRYSVIRISMNSESTSHPFCFCT